MSINQRVEIKQQPELNQQFRLVQKIQISNILSFSRDMLLEKIQEEYINNPVLKLSENNQEKKEIISIKDKSPYSESKLTNYALKTNKRVNQEAADLKQNFIENGLSATVSLQDQLLNQLNLQTLTPEEFRTGKILISNLNENGFFNTPPVDLLENSSQETLDKLVKMIQAFDPPGTCTKNSNESLLIQTALRTDAPPGTEELLHQYWDLLLKRDIDKIRNKMNISQDDMLDILNFLKTLNPFPGASLTSTTSQYIIPDIIVKRRDGWFDISLNNDDFPTLSINPVYDKMVKKKSLNKEEVRFIKNNMYNAEFLISSLNYRNSNLLKVCKAIFEFQLDFFTKGPEMVAPLNLKDIAEEVGLDASTISRITRDKYIQTDKGVYSLKYFFANPVSSLKSGDREYSDITVLHMIKEIMSNAKTKISDKQISAELLKKNIILDRRTVNKYRNRLLHESH